MTRDELRQVHKALDHAAECIPGMAARREMMEARELVRVEIERQREKAP